MSKNKRKPPRNFDVLLSYRREINLATKAIKDKSKYSRKTKHKPNY